MKGVLIFFRITILSCLLVSCTKDTYKEIDEVLKQNSSKRCVVLNGSVTSEYKHHVVYVSESIDYTSFASLSAKEQKDMSWKRRDISGAKVYVEITGNKYNFQEVHYTEGDGYGGKVNCIKYESVEPFAGIPSEEHTLVVEVNGKTYKATDVMPKATDFTIDANSPLYMKTGNATWNIGGGVHIKDTSFTYPEYLFGQPEAFIMRIDNQESFSFRQLESPQTLGFVYDFNHLTVTANSRPWQESVSFSKISCSSIYETYAYNMFKASTSMGFDFGDVLSNMPTNVTNGGVGFFSAHDVLTKRYSTKEIKELAKTIGMFCPE